ncbi:helix-turn-helix domain-containing protein [Nonomuraea sp. NPDC052129]|uniref:helix-turn-helix domain-containing protein n=1 Tax=Nonomuraea sp. NPDC052129 TaxID=3154651 RepID=UPI0034333B51
MAARPGESGRAEGTTTASRPTPSSGRFLTIDDRIVVADLLREGRSVRSVAAEMGRSPSTISCEVNRNARCRGWEGCSARSVRRGRSACPGASCPGRGRCTAGVVRRTTGQLRPVMRP